MPMQVIKITLFALKEKSDNAKGKINEFRIYPDSTNPVTFPPRFTNADFTEVQLWLSYMEDKGYPSFQLVVEDGTFCLANGENIFRTMHDFQREPMNIYTAASITTKFMRLYNVALDNGYKAD